MTLAEKIQVILNQDRLSINEYLTWYKRLRSIYRKSYYYKLLNVSRHKIPYGDQKRLEFEVLTAIEESILAKERGKVQKEEMLKLIEQGYKTGDLAKHFKLTRSHIRNLKNQFGIPQDPIIPRADNTELLAMLKQGLSQAEIARRLGLARSTIQKRISKL